MNIEGYKVISDNIAWDGTSFCCRRCGTSGYAKMAQVRGHLAMCKGKAIQKGIVPVSQPLATQLQPVTTASTDDLKSSPTDWQPPAVKHSYNQSVNDRLARLETKVDNEMTHMLADRNQTAGSINDWVSANKGTLIVIGAGIFLILLLRESSCHCDTTPRYTRSTKNGRKVNSSLNSTLNTAGTYLLKKGIDKVLK